MKKKLGQGTTGEYYNALYTEWRGKRSVVRVIKNDTGRVEENIAVRVVYMDSNECEEPYFTNKHFNKYLFDEMIDKYFCVPSPEYDADKIDLSKGPDFSYYRLKPTKETRKVIALLNKYLFAGNSKKVEYARRVAAAEDITEENPITVGWFMEHPVKMMKIVDLLTRDEDFLKNKSTVDKAYEQLTDEEKSNF